MTLSMKALTQPRRRHVHKQQCPTSGAHYNAAGQPIGQKGAFQMWRRTPRAVTSPGRHLHTHYVQQFDWQLGQAITGTSNNEEFGATISMSADATFLAVGAPGAAASDGRVYFYENIGGVWTAFGTPNYIQGTTQSIGFGESIDVVVNVNGAKFVAIGMPGASDGAGLVQTFEYTGGAWVQYLADLAFSGTQAGGTSVALDRQAPPHLVVGIPGTGAGITRLYEVDDGAWRALYEITTGGTLGQTVAAPEDGETLFVGGGIPNWGMSAFDGTTDTQSTFTGFYPGDSYGNSVTVSQLNKRIAAGGPTATIDGISNIGYVALYKRTDGGFALWEPFGSHIRGSVESEGFGRFVRLDQQGNQLGVGSSNGTARVYRYDSDISDWVRFGGLIHPSTLAPPASLTSFDMPQSNAPHIVAMGYSGYDSGGLTDNGLVAIMVYGAITPPAQPRHYHRGVHPRLELACSRDCGVRSSLAPNCYLNGDTTEYVKDTCPNSASVTRCGLPATGATGSGTAANNLNTPWAMQEVGGTRTRYPGVALDRGAIASVLQPRPITRNGIQLRGRGVAADTRQLLQMQGIDYRRGNSGCRGTAASGGRQRVVRSQVPLYAADQLVHTDLLNTTNCCYDAGIPTGMQRPPARSGAMPNQTYVHAQRVAAERNLHNQIDCCRLHCESIVPCACSQWLQMGNNINGSGTLSEFGTFVTMNGDGTRVAAMDLYGVTRVFGLNGSSWSQLGDDITGFNNAGPVSLNSAGDRIAIGGPNELAMTGVIVGTGIVRVYQYGLSTPGVWGQLGQDINATALSDELGTSVSLNAAGDRLAIGANQEFTVSGTGWAAIYELGLTTPNVWGQLGSDITGLAARDQTGQAVSLDASGGRILIGEPGAGSSAGRVRLFEYGLTTPGVWGQVGSSLVGTSNSAFGYSLSLRSDGLMFAVSAPFARVRAYEWASTDWIQLGDDLLGTDAQSQLGMSVSVSSTCNRLAVGSLNDGYGLATMYQFGTTSWGVVGSAITGPDTSTLGYSVAMSSDGNRVVVGVPYINNPDANTGLMQVYHCA